MVSVRNSTCVAPLVQRRSDRGRSATDISRLPVPAAYQMIQTRVSDEKSPDDSGKSSSLVRSPLLSCPLLPSRRRSHYHLIPASQPRVSPTGIPAQEEVPCTRHVRVAAGNGGHACTPPRAAARLHDCIAMRARARRHRPATTSRSRTPRLARQADPGKRGLHEKETAVSIDPRRGVCSARKLLVVRTTRVALVD